MKKLSVYDKCIIAFISVLAIGLITTIVTLYKVNAEYNHLSFQDCALQEERDDLEATNLKLLEALRYEHRIAVSNDTKLLVADLAWLDRENDTFYMDAFIDLDSGEGNCFKRLKKLFDEDEGARERAINIVCYHLDNLDLYSVTSDYYDQLVAESTTK